MDGVTQAGFRAWARSQVFARNLGEARAITAAALTIAAKPYVSFSCGKDSTVMADIVLRHAPDVPLRFLSSGETRLLHNVDDVLAYFSARGASVTEINIDRVFSADWAGATWDESRRAGGSDLQSMHDHNAYDAAFIGLRAEESPQRRMSLYSCRTPGLPQFVYRLASGRLRICPLARWRTEDIGAYIVARELPLLDAYRENGMDTRTTARLTGTALRMGTLHRLRASHPDNYLAIVARWPELAHLQ